MMNDITRLAQCVAVKIEAGDYPGALDVLYEMAVTDPERAVILYKTHGPKMYAGVVEWVNEVITCSRNCLLTPPEIFDARGIPEMMGEFEKKYSVEIKLPPSTTDLDEARKIIEAESKVRPGNLTSNIMDSLESNIWKFLPKVIRNWKSLEDLSHSEKVVQMRKDYCANPEFWKGFFHQTRNYLSVLRNLEVDEKKLLRQILERM